MKDVTKNVKNIGTLKGSILRFNSSEKERNICQLVRYLLQCDLEDTEEKCDICCSATSKTPK